MGRHTYLLDGDNVRHGLNQDLGFTDADRVENIRRVAEVAQADGRRGLIVLRRSSRRSAPSGGMARELIAGGRVHRGVRRHAAGRRRGSAIPRASTRRRARGELKNFTGIDSPYEAPEEPEIRIDTTATSAEAAADLIIEYLRGKQKLDA